MRKRLKGFKIVISEINKQINGLCTSNSLRQMLSFPTEEQLRGKGQVNNCHTGN